VHFARVSAAVAEMGDSGAARELYKGFEHILKGYHLARGVGGHFNPCQFDFHKFVGHELFVTMFSQLAQEERWETIGELLARGIYMDNLSNSDAKIVGFTAINEVIVLLGNRWRRLKTGVFEHLRILAKRHSEGELAQLIPAKQFAEADLLLYLRSVADVVKPDTGRVPRWWPWSALGPGEVPRYLVEAIKSKERVGQLCMALGVQDANQLKATIASARTELTEEKWGIGFPDTASPLSYFHLESLVDG
jgi:hypothetical protein